MSLSLGFPEAMLQPACACLTGRKYPAMVVVSLKYGLGTKNENLPALPFKVAVQACDHETTRHTKAYLIQTRSTDGNKLYIK